MQGGLPGPKARKRAPRRPGAAAAAPAGSRGLALGGELPRRLGDALAEGVALGAEVLRERGGVLLLGALAGLGRVDAVVLLGLVLGVGLGLLGLRLLGDALAEGVLGARRLDGAALLHGLRLGLLGLRLVLGG